MSGARPPTLAEIRATATLLHGKIARTPVMDWTATEIHERLAPGTTVNLKAECFQHTGTFKPRGALTVMLGTEPAALARGVTAVSAGNHAIATAWAARIMGVSTKVVMTASANPARVEKVRRYGGEVVLAEDVQQAFKKVEEIEKEEGRLFVHPFEGPLTARGTGTLALEWLDQAGSLDAVIIPVGGGGLAAGTSAAFKQACPGIQVFGVEPIGADSMSRSFAAGSPQKIEKVQTIADSLGAPFALPYSYALCRQFIDEIVLVDDRALVDAMRLLFDTLKLACEPAGAASTAALSGPLRDRLAGKRVGVLVCGSNIDLPRFHERLLT